MLALVKYEAGPGNMELRELTEPVAGPGQIKIQVKEAGVCGSDLHIYHSEIAIPIRPPVVVGHEFMGVIREIGEGVEGFAVGDRVVSETACHYCGKCHCCHEGFYNLCVERKTLGYWFNGTFAKYTVVPATLVHKVPDNVSDTAAAMNEPLACVVHAVYDLCRIVAGDLVLVSGPGSIGLMAMQVAKIHGATVVVSGTGIDTERLELAKRLGADYTVNISEESLSDLIMSLSGGYGCDVVLECSGSTAGINSALALIKKRGYFTQIGLGAPKIDFNIEAICYKELHFTGSLASRNHSWRQALILQEKGLVKTEPLALEKYPLDQWETAFKRFEEKKGCKFILVP